MKNLLKKVKDKLYFTINPPPAVIRRSVSDIIVANSIQDSLNRWDIAVKYLAIENYYNKNDFGFDLYIKMQNLRTKANVGRQAVENFKKLIVSWETNGYDENSCIYLDNDYTLQNGAHRLAMALYHNMPYINTHLLHRDKPASFGRDWFEESGFTDEEISVISDKAREIFDKANRPFTFIIWSPAIHLADEIINDLSGYGSVSNVRKYSCTEREYEKIIRKIYSIDDIAKWKIDTKVDFFKKHSSEFVCADVLFPYHNFKMNNSNTDIVSSVCLNAKKETRSIYKDRIENYIYDVILHACDNFRQTDLMNTYLSELQAVQQTVSV